MASPIANRQRAEVEPLIGFFINTQALKVDSEPLAERAAVVGAGASRRLCRLRKNQDVPFEQVVEAVKPTRSLAHSPIFQLMLNWLNMPLGVLELQGLNARRGGEATEY